MPRQLLRWTLLLPLLLAATIPASWLAAAGRGPTVSVITEYTPEGRKVAPPAADRPTFFAVHSGGQRDFGQPLAGEKKLVDDAVQTPLVAALGTVHYLPAPTGRAPALLVIYTWGLHANLASDIEDPGYRNVLDRAALVAGQKFATDLKSVLNQAEASAAAVSQRPWGAQLPGMNPVTPAVLQDGFNPLESFRRRDRLNAQLLEQIADDCYYVVVAAYDYAALARGERRLLWRTKLTTRAQGTSLKDAVPMLLARGAAYFGRDMARPELVAAGN